MDNAYEEYEDAEFEREEAELVVGDAEIHIAALELMKIEIGDLYNEAH
jgi:hypothetical protein